MTGGTLTLAGSVTVTDVVIAGGTLTGPGPLAAGSQVTWNSGTIVGSITNDGSLTVTDGGTATLTGTLTNAGSIVLDTGVTVYQASPSSGASIINQAGATFDLQGTADLSNDYINGNVYDGGTFTNAGTLEKSTGTGTATISYAIIDTGTVVATGGTLSVQGGGTATNAIVTTGTNGIVVLSGSYSGSFVGSGTSDVQLLNFAGAGSGATLDFTGSTLQWTGGSLTGPVTNLGTLAVTASGVALAGTLTNAGSIAVDTGVTVDQGSESSGASIVNQAGATFDLQGTADLSNAYTNGTVYDGGTFTNAGTLEQSTVTGTATLAYALNNSATVDAMAGTLAAAGGGTWSGAIGIGGSVALTGGTFTLDAGASIAPISGGSGTLQVTGGTLAIAGSVTAHRCRHRRRHAHLAGPLAAVSQVTWSSGAIVGSITDDGSLTVTDGGTASLTGRYTNAGSIVLDTGVTVYQASPSSAASIINQAGATFDLQGTADLSNDYINGNVYDGGTFTNAGTLEKSTGTGTATIAYAITGAGAIVVDSATLEPTGTVTGTNASITVASVPTS